MQLGKKKRLRHKRINKYASDLLMFRREQRQMEVFFLFFFGLSSPSVLLLLQIQSRRWRRASAVLNDWISI